MVNKGITIGIFLIVAISALVITEKLGLTDITGSSVKNEESNLQQVEVVPLSAEERAKVQQTLLSSDFIKDVPKNGIISLRFFNNDGGQTIWHDEFLIGKDELLNSGNSEIYLAMHTRYISEMNEGNLCEIINKAINNGELKLESQESKAKLLVKYAGMLKHRECFGVEF